MKFLKELLEEGEVVRWPHNYINILLRSPIFGNYLHDQELWNKLETYILDPKNPMLFKVKALKKIDQITGEPEEKYTEADVEEYINDVKRHRDNSPAGLKEGRLSNQQTKTNQNHLKNYIAEKLFKMWQDDPVMPLDDARRIDDMQPEDKEMFWEQVSKIVEYVNKSKLSLDQAFDAFFEHEKQEVAAKVRGYYYH